MTTRHKDTEHKDTEQAILDMLQRYEVMTMDEILTAGQPNFTWGQVFLAIDRLSRQKSIVIHRVGLSYQICLMDQAWLLGLEQHRGEPAAQYR